MFFHRLDLRVLRFAKVHVPLRYSLHTFVLSANVPMKMSSVSCGNTPLSSCPVLQFSEKECTNIC